LLSSSSIKPSLDLFLNFASLPNCEEAQYSAYEGEYPTFDRIIELAVRLKASPLLVNNVSFLAHVGLEPSYIGTDVRDNAVRAATQAVQFLYENPLGSGS